MAIRQHDMNIPDRQTTVGDKVQREYVASSFTKFWGKFSDNFCIFCDFVMAWEVVNSILKSLFTFL